MTANEVIELLDALTYDQRQRHIMFYTNGAYYDVDGFVFGKGAMSDSLIFMEGKEGED